MRFIRSVFTWSSFSIWVVVVVTLSITAAYFFNFYIEKNTGGPSEAQNAVALQSKEWTLVGIRYNDGRDNTPVKADDFKLTFDTMGKFSGSTDCNSINGAYSSGRRTLSITDIASTKRYCAWSEEQTYLRLLTDVVGYYFADNQLVLELKYQGGTIVFR